MIPQIYHDLFEQSDFISIYATTEPWDDFADSVAYFLSHQYLGLDYAIDTKQGVKIDVMKKLTSPLFEAKYRYIESFLKLKNLRYKTHYLL